MLCVIYSKSKIRKKDFFNCDVNNVEKSVSSMSLNEEILRGFGILININDYKCIVTCFHVVNKNNMKIDAYINGKNGIMYNEECETILTIEEYDISVLKLKTNENIENYDFYDEHDVLKINETLNCVTKDYRFLIKHGYIEGVHNTKIIEINEPCQNLKVVLDYVRSTFLPKIPIFSVDVNTKNSLKGLSGSPLLAGNNIVGFVSNQSEKINCVPMVFAIELIKALLQNNEIKCVYLSTDIMESEQDDKNITCHQITNSYNVTYKCASKKTFKFKNNDVITEINGESFNNDGTIYHRSIDHNVQIDLYLILECIKNYINITFFREQNESYKKMTTTIMGNTFESVCNVRISSTNDIYKYKNYKFAELSEELIKDVVSEDLLRADILQYKTFCDENTKLIVSIHNNEINIVDKIDNKKVKSIYDVKTIMKTKKNHNIVFKNTIKVQL